MRRVPCGVLLALLPLCVVSCEEAETALGGAKFEGRIHDAADKTKGIPGLSVIVTPTVGNAAEKITISDKNGEFFFEGLQEGAYKLELKQGVRSLYKKEIQTKDKRIDIGLKRKQ